MSAKKISRLRRARRARSKMRELGANRLCVHRTPRHIYAQIIAPTGDKVLVSASTLDKDLRAGKTGNVEAAGSVGKLIAERVTERTKAFIPGQSPPPVRIASFILPSNTVSCRQF